MDTQAEIITNFRVCHLRGCGRMGYWSPLISLSPDGIQWAHMRLSHMLMCDHHKEFIELRDLIAGPTFNGESGWERIQGAFVRAGKNSPQIEFTQLKWELA